MRVIVLLLVVLGACAADTDPVLTLSKDDPAAHAHDMESKDEAARVDICALAAALPEGDICRLVCDPDAMAAQLEAEGAETGTCYQFYCQLSETEHVQAGVCLAP